MIISQMSDNSGHYILQMRPMRLLCGSNNSFTERSLLPILSNYIRGLKYVESRRQLTVSLLFKYTGNTLSARCTYVTFIYCYLIVLINRIDK